MTIGNAEITRAGQGIRSKCRRWLLYGIGVPLLNQLDRMVARASLIGNPALFDSREFAWAPAVENSWPVIRNELEAVMNLGEEIPNTQDIARDLSHLTTDDGWKTLIFFGYGYRSEVNCSRCPETMRLLDGIPGITNAAFSVLAPGKHIPRHRGEYKGIVRCHLGLIIPDERENCRMEVAGEAVSWEEGKLIIFDNAYHHEVWNNTPQTRVVLLFDVIRPLRRPWSWVNRAVLYVISRSPYVQSAVKNQRAWDRRRDHNFD